MREEYEKVELERETSQSLSCIIILDSFHIDM